MSYIVNGMTRGRENRAVGSAAGRENMQPGVPPPLQSVPTAYLGSGISTTIARTGEVATATATAHGLVVGDVVKITGADQAEYNGYKRVDTVPTSGTFTFAAYGSPADPATGTITCQKRMA